VFLESTAGLGERMHSRLSEVMQAALVLWGRTMQYNMKTSSLEGLLANLCMSNLLLEWLNPPLAKHLDHIRIHLLRRPLRTDPNHFPLLLKLVNDGHARLDERAEALLDALHVVVCAARRLAAV
jgi:hypothetical protein